MENQDTSFFSPDDEQANKTNTQQPEKTWDGPLLEPERTAQYAQNLINERLANEADKNEGSDNPPLRSELDPPEAPDIVPDQSPDEINYPGKQDIPKIEQPQASNTSIGSDDSSAGVGNEAQELQMDENKKREENIKEKNAELRETIEGRQESIRKSEDGNISDQRGYNEIRENSPVNDERDKEFLN